MPSNPFKPLHDSMKKEVIPAFKLLHKGSVDKISKKELVKICFEKYPVSPLALLKYIDDYYISTGEVSCDSEYYYSPISFKIKEGAK